MRERQLRGLPTCALLFGEHDVPPDFPIPVVTAKELLAMWPVRFTERLDRALCNLVRSSQHFGDEVKVTVDDPALVMAESAKEVPSICRALEEHSLVDPIVA